MDLVSRTYVAFSSGYYRAAGSSEPAAPSGADGACRPRSCTRFPKRIDQTRSGRLTQTKHRSTPRLRQSAAGRQNTGEERANLDGLLQTPGSSIGSEVRLMRLRFPDIPVIQRRHFNVRRRLSRKKAHDRRVGRNLLRKVGMRERHRVASRLHELSKHLVTRAVRAHAALALEDLTRMPIQTRASRRLRRRLSSWPRGELHCQIAYKAQDRGVPIYWVNPYRTSKTCPRCGEVARHRNRVGPKFE